MGSNDMGRLLSGSSWSPCFKMGITSDIFQMVGKVPVVKELLINDVNVGRIEDRQFFKTRTVILSFPGAFPVGITIQHGWLCR